MLYILSLMDKALIYLVDSILGEGKNTSRENRAYFCPNQCHSSKHKLEINFNTNDKGENPYQCWICGGRKGGFKGKKLINLFKKLKVNPDKINQLKLLVKSDSQNYIPKVEESKQAELPKEFISLINPNKSDIITKHALYFLKQRNISSNDIIKYNIGYCEYGKYKNRIIIPSYDEEGNLNYFSARTFMDDFEKYKNPPISRNIIGFELFINWNLPIIIVEGMFDALAVKRNVIPLLGKDIQPAIMKKLVQSKVDKIYIALDNDAKKQAIGFCEQLINEGKEVYFVELNGKDPSELGFSEFTKIIQNTKPLTFSSLFEKKLQLI